jgi:hypothetical protein
MPVEVVAKHCAEDVVATVLAYHGSEEETGLASNADRDPTVTAIGVSKYP